MSTSHAQNSTEGDERMCTDNNLSYKESAARVQTPQCKGFAKCAGLLAFESVNCAATGPHDRVITSKTSLCKACLLPLAANLRQILRGVESNSINSLSNCLHPKEGVEFPLCEEAILATCDRPRLTTPQRGASVYTRRFICWKIKKLAQCTRSRTWRGTGFQKPTCAFSLG